ncbi:hypothetical protein IWW34DRAFT_737870 [Fusarium oxysporum f. sp. albedinis]|nr:hypothetical protein IWW34DRAFT_737870 [Fusarium oxysporum f. sp. albedinis]KAJ0143006.1 Uncharacterized protein HZ326_14180 [Fusarium oxysporum f. sp. albedinis]KAK2473605.1 hypothetical protein H9L39_13565 [Fusarium oxysporum f. sp. albedinis]
MLPYPRGPALTSAEEKLLWDNDVVSKLTEEQWKAFGQWVGANDPTPLEAKHWITRENDLDLNIFSLQTLALLIKQAKFAHCGQSSGTLEQSYSEHTLIVCKPGFGLPLGHMPDEKHRFPLLFLNDDFGDGWKAVVLLIRECCMLKFIDKLSDKPRWWQKINDDEIVTKWKKEALAMDWKSYLKHADFTSAMVNACIQELRIKADIYEKTGLIPVYDYSVAVLKSDTIMTAELAKSLQEAVEVLEDVAPEQKDWHPGSNKKVLDLVHPSLWPLTYGRSRILVDRVIGLQDAFTDEGKAVTIRAPADDDCYRYQKGGFCGQGFPVFSNRFQWLPCDVVLDPLTGSVKIASYINNLHPQEHAHLYPVIESFIKKSLPAWDILYRWEDDFAVQRLQTEEATLDCQAEEAVNCCCKPWCRRLGQNEAPRHAYEPGGEEYEDQGRWSDEDTDEESNTFHFCEEPSDKELLHQDYSDPEEAYFKGSQRRKLDEAWFKSTHRVNVPDADPNAAGHVKITAGDVKTTGFFKGKEQIQVIIKLANIYLTPENPSYDGGSWHTEGQLNEHIVSTALYYYDSDNITDCTLSFRTTTKDLSEELYYEQDKHDPIYRTFAIKKDGDRQQDIGSVNTKAGRAIFFPNLVQHRVSPFELVDRTKPGHRKILALFLVDPAISIISTSNVPPQQKYWWDQHRLQNGECLPDSSNEKVSLVDWPMGLEEAKELRLQLMDERTWMQEQEQDGVREEWNFCEH